MINQSLFKKLVDEAKVFSDDRGSIGILYESDTVVLKRSFSKKGVLRGLHRQISPARQIKVIRIISGKIIDFVADPDEAGEVIWYTELSPKDDWVQIDSHFAHGFYTVEDVVFEYFCDGKYDESLEQSYRVDYILSQELNLQPIYLSDKDSKGKIFGKSVRLYKRSG